MARIPKEPLPAIRSYSYGQYHLIKNLQWSKMDCFNKAIATLAIEDTTICFETVQQYQTLTTKYPDSTLQSTLSQLKGFVNGTFEDQQTTLTNKKIEVINNGTMLFQPWAEVIVHKPRPQSIGTCFLWGEGVNVELATIGATKSWSKLETWER